MKAGIGEELVVYNLTYRNSTTLRTEYITILDLLYISN